jgi:hypothetical protein
VGRRISIAELLTCNLNVVDFWLLIKALLQQEGFLYGTPIVVYKTAFKINEPK